MRQEKGVAPREKVCDKIKELHQEKLVAHEEVVAQKEVSVSAKVTAQEGMAEQEEESVSYLCYKRECG